MRVHRLIIAAVLALATTAAHAQTPSQADRPPRVPWRDGVAFDSPVGLVHLFAASLTNTDRRPEIGQFMDLRGSVKNHTADAALETGWCSVLIKVPS